MNYFSCDRPWAFYGLFFLIPVFVFCIAKYKFLVKKGGIGNASLFNRMKHSIISRVVCWSLAWCMLIAAFSGISWGTKLGTAHQTGSAVSYVFDVSWSMTAQDVAIKGSKPISRLQAAASYGEALLANMNSSEVSAVIAKGNGVTAVPQTSDKNALKPLFASLSPQLMTSVGSSIGGGINAAAESFPLLSVAARTILVFTDGEETDGMMLQAAESVVSSGIQLVFLGFGSKAQTEIISGDGKTVVATALQEENLQTIVSQVNEKVSSLSQKHKLSGLGTEAAKAYYFPANSPGSAYKVLDIIKDGQNHSPWVGSVYEIQSVPRWPLFCVLTIIFLLAGFFLSEFDLSRFRKKTNATLILLLGITFMLQGCSVDWKGAADVVEGTFYWYRKDYRAAVANFMETVDYGNSNGNKTLEQFGVYGLAATYLAQGETEAAISRLQEISPDAPQNIRFAALYNSGIIAYRNGDYKDAASYFKQALLVDGSSIDAKLNLELSLAHEITQSADGSQEIVPVAENHTETPLENTIFSLIREKEQTQWKNQQSQEKTDLPIDY
ncbi:MAG: VWA domain-containing protein [Spirochaetaceae bacterium]|nr:VWA domain-containing protein [Spirochaetaceae bacterium]